MPRNWRTKDLKSSLLFDLCFTVTRDSKSSSAFSVDGSSLNTDESTNDIEILVTINPSAEPECYTKLNASLQDTVRHEIEHLTQGGENYRENKAKPSSDRVRNKVNTIPSETWKYFTLKDEIPAMVHGLYRMAKTEKEFLDTVMIRYLNYFKSEGILDDEKIGKIMTKWKKFAKENLPEAKFSK